MENLSLLNKTLEGFRGLLLLTATYAAFYIDTLTANISGFSSAQIKASAIMSAPIAIKLIWTDARPKILNAIANLFTK